MKDVSTLLNSESEKICHVVEHAGKTVDNYQIMFNGITVIKDCYCGEWMTELISQSEGFHEPQEEKAFFEVLKNILYNYE